MKGRKKTLLRSVILVFCFILLCSSAFASTGSLRVTVLDQKVPVENFIVELCCVADLEDGVYTLTEAFADLHLPVEEIAQECSAEQAEQTYQYVIRKELEGTVLLTDREGNTDYHALTDGLYLVFERGDQAVAFRPYLITIPTNDRYVVYSTPKTNSGQVRNIAVFKEWDDNDDDAGKRPESIEVTLSLNETPIRSVVLNEACGWEHTFIMLSAEGTYAVEEKEVPDYTCTVEEVFEGFLLTNTYEPKTEPDKPKPDDPDPDEPDMPIGPDQIPEEPDFPLKPEVPEQLPEEQPETEPTLPQTGFRMWPVYLMLALGAVLTVLGLADVCLSKETPWEEEQEEP